MFDKFWMDRVEKALEAKRKGADFVVRDSITHVELARGAFEKMRNYQHSYGNCYLEAA